ncbi:hypothetical protein DFP92_10666 [Yoonia sediminilitoris]|uniref:Uncharacterized protein n=1 Tax=Yoonia sediminilitoris TaxID=1286148 RepID=A0A2T6KFT9_9RHOB|nr:hypothetical protein C8N45_10666 [Yoonia sediminilitoris]RCW95123.1 hypothetical protein DFP92_10666 [Yoonia sediminilitoris]
MQCIALHEVDTRLLQACDIGFGFNPFGEQQKAIRSGQFLQRSMMILLLGAVSMFSTSDLSILIISLG